MSSNAMSIHGFFAGRGGDQLLDRSSKGPENHEEQIKGSQEKELWKGRIETLLCKK